MDEKILKILRCPLTQSELSADDNSLINKNNQKFPIIDNIMHLIESDNNDLQDYYENINVKKNPENAFSSYKSGMEAYYRESRKNGLLETFPKNLGLVLDVGGGDGNIFRSILKFFPIEPSKIILADFAATQMRSSAVLLDSQKYFFCKADATKLPFKDNSFDTIFNSEMIEHLYPQDSKKMLDEFFRVLKPGGKLIITTPNRSEYRRLIQESSLSVILFFMRKKGLMEREKLKSKLFRNYLRFTGHTFVNIDQAEKNELIGHFNVLRVNVLKQQLINAGFKINKTTLSIFIPLIVLKFMHKIDKKWYLRFEKIIKFIKLEKFLLASQMHLAEKP